MVKYIHKITGESYSTKNNICINTDIKYIILNLDTSKNEIVNGLNLEKSKTILPTFKLLDTSGEYDISVTFKHSKHYFSSSDKKDDVIGSSYALKHKKSKKIKSQGDLSYGLPLVIYYKDKIYNTTFKNNLSETLNFHPHGLNCDPWVDGASMINEFGLGSKVGIQMDLSYKIYNNSMFSAWHPHTMFRSSPLLYKGLFMPYVVEDIYSQQFSKKFKFTLNKNDIPISFGAVDYDGSLNITNLYRFTEKVSFDVDNSIYNSSNYPNLPHESKDSDMGIMAISLWSGSVLQMNGKIVHGYNDNFWSNRYANAYPGPSDYNQTLTHYIEADNWNFIRLRLIHTGCSSRRNYFGFIDKTEVNSLEDSPNFLEFMVIGAGGGFVTPWKTRMVSVESMNRIDIVIDVHNYNSVFLVSFDFDLAIIEKLIVVQPFLKNQVAQLGKRKMLLFNERKKYTREFFNNYSIYTGCSPNGKNIKQHETILDNKICYNDFIAVANQYRAKHSNMTDNGSRKHEKWNSNKPNPAYYKAIHFIKKEPTTGENIIESNSDNFTLNDISKHINNIINNNKYYYNLPHSYKDKSTNVRYIALQPGMSVNVDCWNEEDINNANPTLLFKLNNDKTTPMLNNTTFYSDMENHMESHMENHMENHMESHMESHMENHMGGLPHITCSNTKNKTKHTIDTSTVPINIFELKTYMNKALENTPIEWNWKAYYKNIAEPGKDPINIKSVQIILKNTSDMSYTLYGNVNVMKLLGVEFGWGHNCSSEKIVSGFPFIQLPENTAKSNNEHPAQFADNKPSTDKCYVTRCIKLMLPSNGIHHGDPFQLMNDNIMNFTVNEGTTERWVFYCNADTKHMDNHPLHFHMTSGFVVPDDISFNTIRNKESINISTAKNNNSNMISTQSIDVMGINSGRKPLVFDVRYPNFNSETKDHNGIKHHLGYMFHCHYMAHHDMNMMGQFYVKSK